MKTRAFIIIMVLFTLAVALNAQEEPKAPKPPKTFAKPDTEFEFDFQNFYKLSEEDEKELLKNINESLRKELEVIKEVDMNKYFDFLRESQFKNVKIPFIVKREKEIHKREQKIFESEVRAEALAAKYKQAKAAEKNKIKENLRKELNVLFEQKEERRQEEVKQLADELKELKKSLAIRQKNKKEIIERRLQDLLDEDQYLDWE